MYFSYPEVLNRGARTTKDGRWDLKAHVYGTGNGFSIKKTKIQ